MLAVDHRPRRSHALQTTRFMAPVDVRSSLGAPWAEWTVNRKPENPRLHPPEQSPIANLEFSL